MKPTELGRLLKTDNALYTSKDYGVQSETDRFLFAFKEGLFYLQSHYPAGKFEGSVIYKDTLKYLYFSNDRLMASGLPQIKFRPESVGEKVLRLKLALAEERVNITFHNFNSWGLVLNSDETSRYFANLFFPSNIKTSSIMNSHSRLLSFVYGAAHLVTTLEDAQDGKFNFNVRSNEFSSKNLRELMEKVYSQALHEDLGNDPELSLDQFRLFQSELESHEKSLQ